LKLILLINTHFSAILERGDGPLRDWRPSWLKIRETLPIV